MKKFDCPHCEKKIFGPAIIENHKLKCKPLPEIPEQEEVFRLQANTKGEKVTFSILKRTFSKEFPHKRFCRQLGREIREVELSIFSVYGSYNIEFSRSSDWPAILKWVDEGSEFAAIETVIDNWVASCRRIRFCKRLIGAERSMKKFIEIELNSSTDKAICSAGHIVSYFPVHSTKAMSRKLKFMVEYNCQGTFVSPMYQNQPINMTYKYCHIYSRNTGDDILEDIEHGVMEFNNKHFAEFLDNQGILYFQEQSGTGNEWVLSNEEKSSSAELGHHVVYSSMDFLLVLNTVTLCGEFHSKYSVDTST